MGTASRSGDLCLPLCLESGPRRHNALLYAFLLDRLGQDPVGPGLEILVLVRLEGITRAADDEQVGAEFPDLESDLDARHQGHLTENYKLDMTVI